MNPHIRYVTVQNPCPECGGSRFITVPPGGHGAGGQRSCGRCGEGNRVGGKPYTDERIPLYRLPEYIAQAKAAHDAEEKAERERQQAIEDEAKAKAIADAYVARKREMLNDPLAFVTR